MGVWKILFQLSNFFKFTFFSKMNKNYIYSTCYSLAISNSFLIYLVDNFINWKSIFENYQIFTPLHHLSSPICLPYWNINKSSHQSSYIYITFKICNITNILYKSSFSFRFMTFSTLLTRVSHSFHIYVTLRTRVLNLLQDIYISHLWYFIFEPDIPS